MTCTYTNETIINKESLYNKGSTLPDSSPTIKKEPTIFNFHFNVKCKYILLFKSLFFQIN